MSHVITSLLNVRDLDALSAACAKLGLELVRGQETFAWYGESVGDYPLPKGFTEDDMGRCAHAIRIPLQAQANAERAAAESDTWYHAPYEIGVVERRDGEQGYQLMYDFYHGGYGMEEKVGGERCEGLVEGYVCAVAESTLGTHWFQNRTVLEDGTRVLEFSSSPDVYEEEQLTVTAGYHGGGY